MRTTIVLAVTAATFVLGLTVIANEKPTAEFEATMKSNGATLQALRGHIMGKDYDGIAMDAATLKANFAKVEAFWTQRKVDDAIGFAKRGAAAAADLETAAKAKNDDQIAAANMAIGGTCGGCHKAHREQLPDKTFEVK
jgi:cytochrome c556